MGHSPRRSLSPGLWCIILVMRIMKFLSLAASIASFYCAVSAFSGNQGKELVASAILAGVFFLLFLVLPGDSQ